MTVPSTETQQIDRNIRAYARLADEYVGRHTEIYNPREQARLRDALERAADEVQSATEWRLALDFGCGGGNLTAHLVDLGFRVVAADVSESFLELIRDQYPADGPVSTLPLGGRDISSADCSFDFVATYSVLHHIPDYLSAVREMARVARPGGVVYIDHESNEHFWAGDPVYAALQQEALASEAAKPPIRLRFLRRSYWRQRGRAFAFQFRRMLDPRYWPEGDIHVWPDDHIEWDRIEDVLRESGCDVVVAEDYLLYRTEYAAATYERYRQRTSDMRVLIARKRLA